MKLKTSSPFIALMLLAGIHAAPAQVTNLGIAPAGNQMILFWPTNVSNLVLQSSTDLSSSNWIAVTDAVPVTAVAVSSSSPARYFRLFNPTLSGTNDMALIPAGPFTMGDNLDGEADATPTLTVTVSAFYMDTNLVSYAKWQSVYGYAISNGYAFDNAGSGKAANHPVQTVNWYDAVKWCNARSQQAGLTPVYYTDSGYTAVYTSGQVDGVYAQMSATGYRLPTEAEWEKAARGGVDGQRFPFGNTISESQADYVAFTNFYSYDLGPNGYNATYAYGNYPYTSPVGSFATNGFGLCDMAGNVLEWCQDWSFTYLGGTDPVGPPSGNNRVMRGGDWANDASGARCARRWANNPGDAEFSIGFRCVRKY